MNIDNIGIGLDTHPPYLVENHRARHHAAGIPAQILEQDKLLLRKLQHAPSAHGLAAQQVQFEIQHAQSCRLACGRVIALEQVAKARQQFGKCEWFGQIIVAALLQPAYPVINRPARRQDEHRRPNTKLSEPENEIDSIPIRQAQIDNKDVECAINCKSLRGLPIGCNLYFIPCFFKGAQQETLNVYFIFYEEKAHEAILVHFDCLNTESPLRVSQENQIAEA